MAEPLRQPTMIALRARRDAFDIATEVLRRGGIDVQHVPCSGCGGMLEPRPGATTFTQCPECGAKTPLPGHLRFRPSDKEADSDMRLDYETPADLWRIPPPPPAPPFTRQLIEFLLYLASATGIVIVLALLFKAISAR